MANIKVLYSQCATAVCKSFTMSVELDKSNRWSRSRNTDWPRVLFPPCRSVTDSLMVNSLQQDAIDLKCTLTTFWWHYDISERDLFPIKGFTALLPFTIHNNGVNWVRDNVHQSEVKMHGKVNDLAFFCQLGFRVKIRGASEVTSAHCRTSQGESKRQ